jgi:asparaginyl-tRNA synthetase
MTGIKARLIERYKDFERKRTRTILSLSEKVREAAKDFLKEEGVLEITPPVLSPATDPGLRGAKQFELDFYGMPHKVTSSMIMQKIAASSHLERDVFSFSPCLRMEGRESKDTGRHLSEFWQIDVELFGKKRDDAMEKAERLLHHTIEKVKEDAREELSFLKRELEVPKLPLKRISYPDMIEKSKELGHEVEYGEEIPWEVEAALSEELGEPFFVVDYPKGSRGFYDRISEEDGGKLLSFDLIYPEGFGEAVSGSEREHDPYLVVEKLKEVGEDPLAYSWFTKMLKRKSCPTSGFGFGFERLVRYISGIRDIKEVTPFPRAPGHFSI